MVKREINCDSSSRTIRRNCTTLITFNEARKPRYVGRCKLKLDLLSQVLFIKPKNEYYNDITAIFDWKFVRSKNILYVFAILDLQDFVLIFKNEEICITVFNAIFKNRDADSVEERLLKERFLNPLFKNVAKNWRLREILEEWIQKFDEKEKNEYLKLLKWHQENPEIDDDENDIKDVKMETDQKSMSRKRRHHELKNYDNDLSDVEQFSDETILHLDNNSEIVQTPSKKQKIHSTNNFTKVIDESKFKIVNFKKNVNISRKLLIFTSEEKTECYEYTFYPTLQFFYHRCKKHVKGINAILAQDENGKECIKMEDTKHRCSPILFEPEKYIKLKIVKKPDYEILENCAAKSKRMLIIFDSNDRSKCYEYSCSLTQKSFYCRGCALKGKRWFTAEIFHEDSEIEYVIFSSKEHVCEKRKYNPEKYFSSNEIVISPNFEIQTKIKNGCERKILIIFHGNDRKFCYKYFWWKHGNRYFCCGCQKQTKVTAQICKNEENEEYVILSNAKHRCSPRIYVPQNKILILRPPNIKFIETNEEQKSKLFIFDSTDPTLCYIFSQHRMGKIYYCLGCRASNKTNLNVNRQTKKIVSVTLEKDDGPNGEYFVQINDGEKHVCQPQKYEPEKYQIRILKPKIDYILIRDNCKNERICLVIYNQKDKKLCYKYYCNKANNIFQCSACLKKNTAVSAKLHRDSAGNEYFTQKSEKKHVCSPIKYSSIVKPNTVILEKSGFDFEEPKRKEIDEKRIVRLPKFELRRNILGIPEKRLIVFFDDDHKFCYDYNYHKQSASFLCKKCNVSAKLQIQEDNDNEKYVVLSQKKHKCEPVKYEAEQKVFVSNDSENGISNYMVFNRDHEKKPAKLVIFTSSTKEMCYEYSYCIQNKNFRCCGCKALKKTISAKLLSENGKEYVQSLNNEHICTPKKFILEEFQPKIILESGFKLCSNKNGKPNSRIMLFDSEKVDFVYEYFLKHNNHFGCLQCTYKKTTVTAKLFEKENGEKFLELSSTKHVCESKKYVPEKIKLTSNFVIHYNDSGVPDSRLTVLNDKDKSLGYRYNFSNHEKLFLCLGCNTKNKYSSAKLITDKDGIQSLQFGKNEHVCTIKNLKNENLYFGDFKFEENGNILITNDPTQKSRFYKFAYDEKLGTFCCSKCLEKKKKYTTATICKENDGKEFVLLNLPHCCTFVSK